MKFIRVILLLSALGLSAFAQQVNVTANKIKVETPSGACSAGSVRVTTAGALWTCVSGTWTAAGGGGLTVGTTTITGGTTTKVLYDNAGVVGEYTVTGTGNVVMSAAPSLTGVITLDSDLFFRRAAAATFALGAADAASPVAQILSVQGVVAGTSNTAGATTTLKLSASTGTGTGGGFVIQGTPKGSTGTTQNSFAKLATLEFPATAWNNSATNSANLTLWGVGGTASSSPVLFAGPSGSLAIGRSDDFPTTRVAMGIISGSQTGYLTIPSGGFYWSNSDSSLTTIDTGIVRAAAAQIRLSNGSTGAGGLLIGSSSATGTAGALTVVGALSSAAWVGPDNTNATFKVDTATASAATGISVTGAAAGSGVTVAAISSGTDENLILAPKGVGVFEQRNSTNPQQFYSYNTYTSATNYERMFVGWNGNTAYITTQKGASGTLRDLTVTSGSALLGLGANGGITWYVTTTDLAAAANTSKIVFGGSSDGSLARLAAGVLRVGNGSTGAGSLVLGTSTVGSIGTSGVGVLAVANGTAPSSSPADEFQLYSADSAAGDANAFIGNEAGEVNRLSGLAARNSAAFAVTSNTTLANITGLTRNVEAGRAYAFRAVLETTAAATGGVKFAVSGTATATSINYEGKLEGGAAVIAQTRATALDTTVCASTTTTAGTCTIEGVLVIGNAGTLTIQFAQNSSDGGASTVLVNQYLQLIPIS